MNNSIEASLAIRKPASEVYNAFIDRDITTKFWFTHSSASLSIGQKLFWEWKMYGVKVPLEVKELVTNERILIEWGEENDLSNVEWEFIAINDDLTFVKIKHYNLKEKGEALTKKLVDSMGGFTLVLAGLKAYLEHELDLKLVDDKFPKEMR